MRLRLITARLAALLLLGVTGCEVSVPFEPDGPPPPATVGGAFSPDSTWGISLIGSTPYGSGVGVPFLPAVEAASVEVENVSTGDRLTLSETAPGRYTARARPAPDATYRLNIQLPTGETLRASGTSPSPPSVSVDEVEALGIQQTPTGRRGVYRVRVRLGAAVAGESLIVDILPTDGTPDPDRNRVFFSSDDPDLRVSFADDGQIRNETIFAVRAVYLAPLLASREISFLLEVPLASSASVRLRVTALSPPVRDYLASVDVQQDRGNDPFVEPVRLYSNVENGAGVFGGFVARDIVITLPTH